MAALAAAEVFVVHAILLDGACLRQCEKTKQIGLAAGRSCVNPAERPSAKRAAPVDSNNEIDLLPIGADLERTT